MDAAEGAHSARRRLTNRRLPLSAMDCTTPVAQRENAFLIAASGLGDGGDSVDSRPSIPVGLVLVGWFCPLPRDIFPAAFSHHVIGCLDWGASLRGNFGPRSGVTSALLVLSLSSSR
jgi:hypothetical protein